MTHDTYRDTYRDTDLLGTEYRGVEIARRARWRVIRMVIGVLVSAIMMMSGLVGCVSPGGDTVAEKRQAAQDMRAKTLAKLYQIHPGARIRIDKAAGYAAFSNINVNLILLSAGSGWGVAHDRASGRDTYMRMVSGGVGFGLGVKDFRGVFVFDDRKSMEWFVNDGWDASGQADAAAKAADKGGAWAGSVDVAPGIHLYQMTENGLALQATVQGTKFWKDDSLN